MEHIYRIGLFRDERDKIGPVHGKGPGPELGAGTLVAALLSTSSLNFPEHEESARPVGVLLNS